MSINSRLEDAIDRHGDLGVDRDAFESALDRLEQTDDNAALHHCDLYLAVGCIQGTRAALQLLDRCISGPGRDSIARIDPDPDFVDEVLQQVRVRLLVGDPNGGEPKLAAYAGRGSLTAWVSVITVRTALNLLKSQRRGSGHRTEFRLAVLSPHSDTLGIGYTKGAYADQLQDAVEEAFASLPAKDRTILRLYVVDGLNIDAIGGLYGVHRSTVARWLAHGRTAVCEHVETKFRKAGVGADAFGWLTQVLVSQLDIHFSELLRSHDHNTTR